MRLLLVIKSQLNPFTGQFFRCLTILWGLFTKNVVLTSVAKPVHAGSCLSFHLLFVSLKQTHTPADFTPRPPVLIHHHVCVFCKNISPLLSISFVLGSPAHSWISLVPFYIIHSTYKTSWYNIRFSWNVSQNAVIYRTSSKREAPSQPNSPMHRRWFATYTTSEVYVCVFERVRYVWYPYLQVD